MCVGVYVCLPVYVDGFLRMCVCVCVWVGGWVVVSMCSWVSGCVCLCVCACWCDVRELSPRKLHPLLEEKDLKMTAQITIFFGHLQHTWPRCHRKNTILPNLLLFSTFCLSK